MVGRQQMQVTLRQHVGMVILATTANITSPGQIAARHRYNAEQRQQQTNKGDGTEQPLVIKHLFQQETARQGQKPFLVKAATSTNATML